ncbi:2-hydroxyacid dehydrogenase [Neorhizobium galegae]|uniref:2-hydroxyacid dehydrogenase n=1 Tax=Neorhizobium galegae TaxID=399 RepID=UPI002100A7FC|nr:2-hydroxyacid dehydrogenase [Neorhizobium galegae]MCQ1571528.1 2-hydroxyacid dehydrogenase [Neorhizobium galegae]
MSPRIVFHGENAACFSENFTSHVAGVGEVAVLPDVLSTETERRIYAEAEFIVGVKFDASLPTPKKLSLFHVPGAGYDAVDLSLLPDKTVVCNCFGHDPAIAEYVFAAMLSRHIPIQAADRKLRAGEWAYWSGALDRVHGEMSGKTVGLVGFGHIGKAIARRAKAFDMGVTVANRSRVEASDLVDRSFSLDELVQFWPTADFIVVSVPLTPSTRSIVDSAAFAVMKPDAVIFNVGRGPTIDEQALFDALRDKRIGGAVIDTWYDYPSANAPMKHPSSLPFHQLDNIVMTPHMSGWTNGTIRRRQRTIADNVNLRLEGGRCINVVRDEVRRS